MIAFFFLLATVTYRPPEPTVGDPITIEYAEPVTVKPSPEYEIVSHTPTSVVVRTFAPNTITVHSTAADVVIPIKSVLAPDDAMKPAPLRPPHALPPSRAPWIAIAIAALCAAVTWFFVWRHRFKQAVIEPVVPSDVRFRNAVRDAARAPRRWAALADATRAYIASAYPGLGIELTTAELLARSGELAESLRPILQQGDLEKFSPWGPQPADFDAASAKALELIVVPVPERDEVAA